MSNKERLSNNNINLDDILLQIQNLPPAGTEDISTEIQDLDNAITELSKVSNSKVAENNGEGIYLWEKTYEDGTTTFIVASDPSAYPTNGTQDGISYKLYTPIKKGILFNEINDEGYPTDVTFNIDHTMYESSSSAITTFKDYFDYIENAEIICDTLEANYFNSIGTGSSANKKIKLKCTTIENEAMKNAFGSGSTTNFTVKIWISDICENITTASSWGKAPFTYCGSKNIEFYCESESKKSNWGSMWNYKYGGSAATTYYGITEEAFDAL